MELHRVGRILSPREADTLGLRMAETCCEDNYRAALGIQVPNSKSRVLKLKTTSSISLVHGSEMNSLKAKLEIKL